MAKIKAITRQGTSQPLSIRLRQINAALRSWTVYFRHGCSKQTFNYLNHYTWLRVFGWLRRKHRRGKWKAIRRRYLGVREETAEDGHARLEFSVEHQHLNSAGTVHGGV